MGKNIDISLYKARRSSPRWEGTKGFLWGALPAGALGFLAGAAVGLVAIGIGSIIGGPLSFGALMAEGSILPVLEVAGLVGLGTGLVSGGLAGYNNSQREQITAIELNRDLDNLIGQKISQNQGLGQAVTVAKDEPHGAVGKFVEKLKHPVDSISTMLADGAPGPHAQALLESRMADSSAEKHR